ncbi:MAG: hypothetical protein WDW36_008170 [Sanguina aurantia]
MTVEVGSRVQLQNERATVRYIGAVSGQEGSWVGVEWDDPCRGKHDGSAGGSKYFETTSGPTAGSFIRAEKLPVGLSVQQAVIKRYHHASGTNGDTASDELYVETSSKRKVVIHLIGERKVQAHQSRTQLLTAARLVRANVSHVGAPSALRATLSAIQELDLTGNLIHSWAFVEQLALALPTLEVLNLSDNLLQLSATPRGEPSSPPPPPLALLPPPPLPPPPLLPGLRALVLNDCGVSWRQVVLLDPQLPNLEELHLCGNRIASLEFDSSVGVEETSHGGSSHGCSGAARADSPAACTEPTGCHDSGGAARPQTPQQQQEAGSQHADCFAKLQVLNLEDNLLTSWAQLSRLATLPSLAKLHLSGNAIPSIQHPTPPPATTAAPPPSHPATQSTAASPAHPPPPPPGPTTAEAPQPHQPQPQSQASGASHPQPAPDSSSRARDGGGAAAAAAAAGACCFPSLGALFMGGCGVTHWDSVDALSCFPKLAELRLSGNPVLGLSRSGGRYEVIGRVPSLRWLNGAEVSVRERKDSELRYLQNVVSEMEAAVGADARDEVKQAHPQLGRLLDTYGTVLATARSTSGGSSMASSVVELTLTCVAATAGAKMGSQVKKLPRSVTVASLRLLLEKLFRVKGRAQSLFLRAPGDPLPEPLGDDNDQRPLSFFGVQDGYEILVDEVDPVAAAAAASSLQSSVVAAAETRLQDQLRSAAALAAEFQRSMGTSTV